jgi:molybdate transport system substrate-binding protein
MIEALMVRKYISFVIVSIILLSGCLQDKNDNTREITVSAAISLSDALKDIGIEFQKKHPDIRIYFNFGASGTLERQIEQGALVDIFASASQKEMDSLEEKGLILKETRTNFSGNKLVIISSSRITIEELKNLDRIAIGNPGTVPAGQYAKTFLERAGMFEVLQPKLIFAENVRQVLDYVERDEVDAGFVYFSDTLKSNKNISSIDDSSYQPIVYPIAVVQGSQKSGISRQFIEFIQSDEGQTILQKHGFG